MLEAADTWFIKIVATCGALYFLWSFRSILKDFKDEVKDLKNTLKTLFRRGDDHEHRLSRIEGRCEAMHPDAGPLARSGGRRFYDPDERTEEGN